ncbi:uncharacterized protein TRIVIDRAFT_30735 [Trichoderma virens Gv29-8]|uniref:U3 snoRNA associated n=1 Tax=Hypocrea virens (strain Gv29-8 / FGSC 10586) TaxID=413071 RepID=G9MMM9_HYPVG|nr:uncharacterized protein TRIVIDRAFT_30735 [Trichoderma virens Gv29-8]EHK24597.1 hypothetical protein TRIVIDRAFT_30735 [Trichoderma virens Gv29-8]
MVFDDNDEAEFKTPVSNKDDSEYKTPNESFVAPEAAATETAEVEEEQEDSDDEAPEAVSTAKAAEDIKKSAKAAQKAAQEQAATQKRKRQQRDELLKKQAEERKKIDEAKPQNDQPEARQTESGTRGRKRTEIPAVLPAEFLTDSSSEDEADDSTGVAAGPKRRKVAGVEKRLTRLDAGPKDEVVKSTVYRVAKKTDERLAPKLKKHSKSSKDLLLKRNRPAATSATGFFKRK